MPIYFNSWNVQETNTALYVQFNLLGEIGGISYTGNVGVRYINTESTSTGFQQADGGELTAVSIDHDYSEVLPALNLRFDITDDSQIRFGLSRAISRPPLIECVQAYKLIHLLQLTLLLAVTLS